MLKRFFDLVLASVLLAVTMPIFGLIALAIWMDSGRPILFSQPRSGRHGRRFDIYKFRTLATNTGIVNTPQVHETRAGTWLRRWGLDELPQLWNVVRGEMSLVGPRPTLPEQVAQYGAFEQQRLAVRPGLTGWAQIHGRNAIDWPERIELDVWYVRHRSLWLDVSIILQTPLMLLSGKGVHGPNGCNSSFPPTRPTSKSHPCNDPGN